MEKPEIIESPRKRQKTDDAGSIAISFGGDGAADLPPAAIADAQTQKEIEVGITEFVSNDTEGFAGILKKRYTDFAVNEITTTGEVVHLRNTKAPHTGNNSKPETPATAPASDVKPAEKTEGAPAEAEAPAEFKVSEEDHALLVEYFGAKNATDIIALHAKAMSKPKSRPSEFGQVTVQVTDRDLRTKIHQAIRRIFTSQLESTTDSEGNMGIIAAANRFKREVTSGRGNGRSNNNRTNWEELGGQYLHFTLYKENKDTMEVVSFLARSLKMNAKVFQFAGTKDRRGVTAQRVCATRLLAERLARLNPTLRNAVVGDFEYRRQGLDLGDLNGNEFVITLRELGIPGVDLKDPQAAVAKASEIVGTSLKNLRQRGYFNYYGLQRFGTFSTRTDTVGVKMLQEDFKGACEAILHYGPESLQAAMEGDANNTNISSDDRARAMAINMFETGGPKIVNEALQKLPRKFSAEQNLIRHLGRSRNDYLGALQTIPRNLRLMYVHAHQSLIWNFAASERWRLYGEKVVEGDLVIVQEHRDKEDAAATEVADETVDADGEVIIVPQGEDSAVAAEDMFTRARALTAEEAASGKYTLFDIVLPQPGYDIIYPENKMKDFYTRFMASEKGGFLDPSKMRRSWKDISLSGSYRKVFSRMLDGDYSFDVKLYTQDDEQFVPTDLQVMKQNKEDAKPATTEAEGDKMAVVLKFQLGSSQYATMALRELTKGKAVAHKADFGGGRKLSQFELFVATRASQALLLPVVLIASSINEACPSAIIDITFEDAVVLGDDEQSVICLKSDGKSVTGTVPIIQNLYAHFPFLAGKESQTESLWITQLVNFEDLDFKALDPILQRLNSHLLLRSFITDYSLSTPDIAIWGAIRGNRVAAAAIKKGNLINLTRWYTFVEELCPRATVAVDSLNAASRERKIAKAKEGASYDIALRNTDNGVVTRFPPEPSGYLHIGHAKAALLNDYFAHEKYNGTLLLRFDDTNPSNEKEEFQDAIMEDLELMGIQPDRVSYTSDYFDQLHNYCLQLIQSGMAYADDTDNETMQHQRREGIPSQRREISPQNSLAHFREMKKGTPEGLRWCIRAKISFDNKNKAMRDPVIYRCNPSTHHRTGDAWVIYPTYDFACPVVDSMEGVTHALRTAEYRDRNPQYQWMLDALSLRTVQVWDFARMNFIRTLLSKRKLTKLVESGVVWGWDDPRFPTIRGIRRRGMTIPALREFILRQGPSKNVTLFDWALIWATNKKYIDPVAPRYTAIEAGDVIEATVIGGPTVPYTEKRQKHAKNLAVGEKDVAFSSSIILEQVDGISFKENEEITLMNWGNMIVRKIATDASSGKITHLDLELHMDGDVKRTEKKVTWLSTKGQTLVPVELVDFDYLLHKDSLVEEDVLEGVLNFNTEFRVSALADSNVVDVSVGDIIQFDRKGFYRVDRAPSENVPGIFFNVPTGKQK